jgi:hypothetical protein
MNPKILHQASKNFLQAKSKKYLDSLIKLSGSKDETIETEDSKRKIIDEFTKIDYE